MSGIKSEGTMGLTRPGGSWASLWRDAVCVFLAMGRQKGNHNTDSKADRRHDKAGLETDMARGATERFKQMGHGIEQALQKDCSSGPAEKSMEGVISGCHETG